MSDLSKNIWIAYNGEIYNFKELRTELQKLGHRFKSNTDTEVIIYAYIEWGIDVYNKFNGMFAFSLYDNYKKKFYLAEIDMASNLFIITFQMKTPLYTQVKRNLS